MIERYGAPRAFDGGLQIKTTLDLELQRAAEQAVNDYLAYSEGPTAALVAIENSTGEVRAMVGGRNYDESPFNLATEGERQPGSSFKAFDLAAALEDGISPDSVWASKEKVFIVPNTGGKEQFVVHNDEGAYTGSNTLTGATAFSDNSIYAEVGLKVGTSRIAALAHRMGITTPLSTNPAMTIGGLTVGVTPLDMAHAYETIAHGGERVSGTLAEDDAPGGHPGSRSRQPAAPRRRAPRQQPGRSQAACCPPTSPRPRPRCSKRCSSTAPARAAAIGQFAAGKTGTTSNYGDAWFVGWDSKYTVAVWVGYPNKLIPMTTDFNGGPVLGGTFPALIWHDFMISALQIEQERAEQAAAQDRGARRRCLERGRLRSERAGLHRHDARPDRDPGGAGKANGKPATPSGAGSGAAGGAGAATPEHAAATPTPTPAPAHEAPSARRPRDAGRRLAAPTRVLDAVADGRRRAPAPARR